MALAVFSGDRRRHWVAAAVTFGLVAAASLLAAFLPRQRYDATTVVSVQPTGRNVSTQLLTFLIPSLEARVTGHSFASQVAGTLPAALRQPAAAWAVDTSVEPGSGVLRITVNSPDRRVPVPAANAYAQALAHGNLDSRALRVLVIDPAREAKSATSRTTILVSGISLAVILSLLVAFGPRIWTRGTPEVDAASAATVVAPAAYSNHLPLVHDDGIAQNGGGMTTAGSSAGTRGERL